MASDKNVNSKVLLAATAIGAGVLVGLGSAFIYYKINSNLNNLVSHLQNSIQEVKEELANLENEINEIQGPLAVQKANSSRRRVKKVSFSSSASATGSYKTAFNDTPSNNEDAVSWRTGQGNETDYFSLDEDDDEFFDIYESDDENRYSLASIEGGNENLPFEVTHLSNLLKRVDALNDKTPQEQIEAYNLLRDSQITDNSEILWRLARASRNLAMIEESKGNLENKKHFIEEGYCYAKQALAINDRSADTNKWFAILSGVRGQFLPTKDRIASGQDFKKHIDIAIKLSSNDSTLHHLLGRFCYELSLLTWMERKIASTLFSEVPTSSFDEALEHFLLAEDLKPLGWKENRVFIAKCHLQKQNKTAAESWIKRALEVKSVTADDEILDKDIEDLLNKYSLSL